MIALNEVVTTLAYVVLFITLFGHGTMAMAMLIHLIRYGLDE